MLGAFFLFASAIFVKVEVVLAYILYTLTMSIQVLVFNTLFLFAFAIEEIKVVIALCFIFWALLRHDRGHRLPVR